MSEGFSYGNLSGAPYPPFWLASPSPHPPASAPPFLTNNPIESYDPTQGVFDPVNSHAYYHRSPSDWPNNPSSRSQTPSTSFYADNNRPGNYGPRDDMFSSSGVYSSRESSSCFVPLLSERQCLTSSAPPVSSSLSDMLITSSQEPFFQPIGPSGLYALDLEHIYPGYDKPERVNAVSGPPQPLFDGRSFPSSGDIRNHAPESFTGAQSNLRASSIDPVNFDVLLGFGEATGHFKPLSGNPDVRSSGSQSRPLGFDIKSSGSLLKDKIEGNSYQRPNNMVTETDSGISVPIDDVNCDEHRSWNHFMGAYEGPSAPTMFPEVGGADQPSEQIIDIINRDKKTDLDIKGTSCRTNADDVSPERQLLSDQVDSPSPTSSPRVSSMVNAMHNLSEVLVYECFNNGRWLKLEELENLDKVVDNLTKCLKKITSNNTVQREESSLPTQAMHVNKTIQRKESSLPTQAMHDSSPYMDMKTVANDFEGFNVNKPKDSYGFKKSVDKNDMTQSIKNILASNFPDGEENHPQTLLFKNLWLETEAALCSTTVMARYHRIKDEIDNSADASTFMQVTSVPIMNNVEQEIIESVVEQGGNCVCPQGSRFNSDPVDAVLSLMSRGFTGGLLEQENHGKIPDTIEKQSSASTAEVKYNDVMDRFQILKHQETKRKLKSQNCLDSDIDVTDLKQHETARILKSQSCPETKMAADDIDRSSHVSDVMDRFQILKRREAEQVENTDSDSDNDQPGNVQIETCTDAEPSASGKGNESLTSDWEHVIKDDWRNSIDNKFQSFCIKLVYYK